MRDSLAAIKNILAREREARRAAESILEEKSYELYAANKALKRLNHSLEQEVNTRTKGIQRSEELHRTLFEQNPFPILIVDLEDFRILSINQTAIEAYGYSRSDLLGKSLAELELIPSNSNPSTLGLGETARSESQLKMANGQKVAVELSKRALWFEGRRSALIMIQDITDRKKAQEALRRSEEKYRGIMENLELGLLEVDPNDLIVKAYPRFCSLTGYTEEELVGKMAKAVLLPESSLEILEQQESLRKDGKASVFEVQIRHKSGRLIWVIISGAPFYDENNQLKGSIGIHLDITDRKDLEIALRSAKEMAEDSAQVKERFMASMSHEIRTPMNGIMGLAELLEATGMNSEQQEYLSAIRKSASNLLVIINDILDFSKIEADRMELTEQVFEPGQLIEQLYATIYYKAEDKGLSLETHIDQDIPRQLMGDPVRLNQILLNLASNAIKFTESGKVSICLDLEYLNSEFARLSFEVTDTGIGIPQDKILYIFESFRQADKSIGTKYGGTGLGLTISRDLVRKMGGELLVESESGRGSSFKFFIDLKRSSRTIDKTGDSRPGGESSEDLSLEGNYLLLVEDDPINQMVARRMLEQAGAVVELAENGSIAIDKIKLKIYDVVLMDVFMPVMNGLEATNYIREKLKLDVPIVALTANALKGDEEKFIAAGMTSYLAKPFKREALLSTVASLINPHQRHLTDEKSRDKVLSKTPEKTAERITEALRWEALRKIAPDDLDFQQEMLEMFSAQAKSSLAEMSEALAEGNGDRVYFLAHRLKFQIDIMGGDECRELVRQLERDSKNDLDAARMAYPRFSELLSSLATQASEKLQLLRS